MKTIRIVLVMLVLGIAFTNFNIAGDVKVTKKDLFERRKEIYESKKKELKEAKKELTENKIKLDPGFEPFWKEFQKIVTKSDKSKIAFMMNFPLNGDFAKGFMDDYGNQVDACTEANFIKIGFDDVYQLWVNQIGKISNLESGLIEKNTMFRFTSFPDLAKAGSLPDYLTNAKDGVELEIYDYITLDETFSMCYYFEKVNGIYKLIATQYTD